MRPADTSGRSIAAMIGAIGTRRFPDRFLGAMRSLVGVSLCSAFTWDDGTSLRLLFAAGEHPTIPDFALRASLDYARGYWHADHAAARARAGTRPVAVRRSAREIADPDYRYACYDRAGVVERVTIYAPGPRAMFASGYRTADMPPIAPAAMDALEAEAALLLAAIERNAWATRRIAATAGDDEALIAHRLSQPDRGLSRREAEICAGLILGRTQAEIAARKRLALGTVVTYRRRAYAKLGVADRRSLSHLYRRLAEQ